MVDFIGIERVRQLVARRGPARFIEELAGEIEADFLRWGEFDKSARHATHSPVGERSCLPTERWEQEPHTNAAARIAAMVIVLTDVVP